MGCVGGPCALLGNMLGIFGLNIVGMRTGLRLISPSGLLGDPRIIGPPPGNPPPDPGNPPPPPPPCMAMGWGGGGGVKLLVSGGEPEVGGEAVRTFSRS